ncbi:MAG TPA: winged helix-turn-helix domain-containing protein [Vicinamibacterales bacterium]|nr:winged helix-turn-helix domain-containing protein [Vicinamibacterales bacterium]
MRTKEGVASVLFGRARQKVLGWLLTHPGDEYFLRELAHNAHLAPSTVKRELDQLVKGGLVTRARSGNQVYFSANEASPVFRELQSVLIKTSAIADVLRLGLHRLRGRITAAYLVGPAVRGELRDNNPIDLLVVGDVDAVDVQRALARAQETLGRTVRVEVVANSPTPEPAESYVMLLTHGDDASH